ncbi:MAG: hypothetical protein EOO39_29455 [Cytophagaceae bacterium]|nr:MAG: hypothetical protein EOO39_29455 [Cytophagaceae bacterium]
MTLFLIIADEQTTWREFNCELGSLEAHVDFLSQLVASGNTLLSAYLLNEDGSQTTLPLAAFDGCLMSTTFLALQEEWTLLLSRPVLSLYVKEELSRIAQQRIDCCLATISVHQKMIGWLNQWLERNRKTSLSQHYEHRLASRQAQITTLQSRISLLTTRINYLEARSPFV